MRFAVAAGTAGVWADQLESFCERPEVQTGQFPFRAPSLEGRGASIHPSFAAGEQAVD